CGYYHISLSVNAKRYDFVKICNLLIEKERQYTKERFCGIITPVILTIRSIPLMVSTAGKYLQKKGISAKRISAWLIPASFFLIELFAFVFLKTTAQEQTQTLSSQISSGEVTSALYAWWPLVFGGVWTILLTGLISALPG